MRSKSMSGPPFGSRFLPKGIRTKQSGSRCGVVVVIPSQNTPSPRVCPAPAIFRSFTGLYERVAAPKSRWGARKTLHHQRDSRNARQIQYDLLSQGLDRSFANRTLRARPSASISRVVGFRRVLASLPSSADDFVVRSYPLCTVVARCLQQL